MSADIVVPPCVAVQCTLALASLLPLFPLLPCCALPMSYIPVPVPVQLPVDDDGDVSGFLEHRPPSGSASVFALPDRHHPCVTSLRLSCSCPACCVSTSCISMPLRWAQELDWEAEALIASRIRDACRGSVLMRIQGISLGHGMVSMLVSAHPSRRPVPLSSGDTTRPNSKTTKAGSGAPDDVH